MSTKKALIVAVVASALLLAVGLGPQFTGTARALPPVQEPGPTGAAIPYPGQLTDEAGQVVADGAYDFTFAVYGSETGGEPLWTETQEGVTVQGGAFTALLGSVTPIPKEVLGGSARWLAVEVRGPGEEEFTALAPRQQLSAAASTAPASPSAGPACPHDHFGEQWVASGAGFGLIVDNNGTGDGIRGYTSSPGVNNAGLFGVNDSASSGGGPGTYGYSDAQAGVFGISGSATPLTYFPGGRTGVYGIGPTGVYGYAAGTGAGDGVVGQASASNKSGVYGYNSGSGYGVAGRSASGWGLEATGNDAGAYDKLGDLVLRGTLGEIFSFGTLLDLYSDGNVVIDLDDNNNDSNAFFRILNGQDQVVHEINENGTKSAILQTESYGQRAVYTMESPEVWLEDFGTASLVDGAATVAFEPIFAETVNLDMDYHVFVTPLCQEPVLLFVTAKGTSGFTVQGVTLDGQPAACGFDYRVVAKRLGLEDIRLEPPAMSASQGNK